ncbi:MAG: hypothetical protein J7K90_09750 [Desulfuromusa sp.]|nr:hypothetical protein [Desulfuromusa sp.]
MTQEELKKLATDLEAGKTDYTADELRGKFDSPMEGTITISFNCKGGVKDTDNPNLIKAGVFIEHDAQFGDMSEKDLLNALKSPEAFLEAGEVVGIAAIIMKMIFGDEGLITQAIKEAGNMQKEAMQISNRENLLRALAGTFGMDFDEIMKMIDKKNKNDGLKNCKPEGSC